MAKNPPHSAPRQLSPLSTTIPEEQPYFSRAVGKAFEILEYLNRSGDSMSLTELSRAVSLTKTSALRLIGTLVSLGHVKQGADGRYILSAENWTGSAAQLANVVATAAREPALSLRSRYQETVSIAVLCTNHIEVIESFESPRIIRMANVVGGIIPPHASSLGKAILAFQPQARQHKLIHSYGLRRFTDHTLTDEETLFAALGDIRKGGFAMEDEEAFLDGCCVGVPIFGGADAAVAAISVSMPKFRFPNKKDREKMITELRQTGAEISQRLTVFLTRR
jgi:DNA-binding IclR family transcriptional regulator